MGPIQFFGDKRGSIKVLQKYLISFVVVVFLSGFCFGLFCFFVFLQKIYNRICKKKTTLNNFGVKKIFMGMDKVSRGLHKKKLK